MGKTRRDVNADVCIVGAGPHGLAASLLFERIDPSIRVVVLDQSNEWLKSWKDQFKRLEIPTLRSPIVHHPSPDSFALDDFVKREDFSLSGLPYNPPTTEAFEAFCSEVINASPIDDPVVAIPRSIRYEDDCVIIDSHEKTIYARYLIIASNPQQTIIPRWAKRTYHQNSLIQHSSEIDLANTNDMADQRIAVIGGGLTAAHLTRSALDKGALVDLILRRPLQIRNFDTDPGWLGPKYLTNYYAESDAHKRIKLAREARNGGSIPPWMRDYLVDYESNGNLIIRESKEVASAKLTSCARYELTLCNEKQVNVDQVWLATGTQSDLYAMECLRPFLHGITFVDGFPVTSNSLRLGQNPIYVMGRSATFALGPSAGNLWGATRAAKRIAADITGVELIANGS